MTGTRVTRLTCIAFCILALALPESLRAAAGSKPNIILILADDLGYGELGCYGQTRIKTPNLDKMAEEGMRFTQAYSGSTVCAPSRCALMTGLHTGHSRIRGNAKVPLVPDDVTVAEVLQKAGYFTALIGKWGLGNENTTGVPWKQGFNEFVGYLDQVHAHNYYPENLWRYNPVDNFEGEFAFPENENGGRKMYSHDLFAYAAQNFVRIHKPTDKIRGKNNPFFLFLAFTIPHANNEEGKRSGNGMQVPSTAPYSEEAWPEPEKCKAAMITRMDADIGRLLQLLKELKIDEDTIVFFTSDNGPHKEGGATPTFFRSSGPFRGYKRDLYEGGIRVPMIVRWPGKIKAGQVSPEPWAFWDFLTTAADVAGVTNVPKTDGISIAPTLLGRAQTNRHDAFYWEFHERGFQQSARIGNWKGVLKTGEPFELYDLSADPAEQKNVADDHKDVVDKMQKFLQSERKESPEFPKAKAGAAGKKKKQK